MEFFRWILAEQKRIAENGESQVVGFFDPGETNRECALRELEEETGIKAEDIRIDKQFKFKSKYKVSYKKEPGIKKKKTLIIYLAELTSPVKIKPTEHQGYSWIPWTPPHKIQKNTIDPLLEQLADHWRDQ
jgi:8-oxo-dGTP pyrophosphatase MutT (NUDIX family)